MDKSPTQTGRKFRLMLAAVEQSPYADCVHGWLDRKWSGRHSDKILARITRATPGTVKNWRRKRNAPSGEHLMRLIASCDELKAEIDQLVDDIRAELK
jgi:hypothetical protein